MDRRFGRLRLPLVAFLALLAACSEAGPVAPPETLDLAGDEPLAAVLPDLAPEAGTAGTDRYVPTLERILRRSVGVIREMRGEDAAGQVVARARALRDAVRAAREAGDTAAFRSAVRDVEAYSARVGVRVFGPRLARHVMADAAGKLATATEKLRAAHEAGRDVGRLAASARVAHAHLQAARDAWAAERPVVALVHAAEALDRALRLGAALD